MRWSVLIALPLMALSGIVWIAAAQEPLPAQEPQAPDAAPAPAPVEPTPAPAAPPPVAPPTAAPATPLPPPPSPPLSPAPAPEPSMPLTPEGTALPEPTPADAPLDYRLYGGIAGAAAGAALIVVAGIAMSRVRQLQDDTGFEAYRAALSTDQDACDEAENGLVVPGAETPEEVIDRCDEATRWEITSYVTLPTGVVLVGLGIYFVLTSDTAQEGPGRGSVPSRRAWRITPAVDLEGASLSFETRF